jgi:hypothetical protein
VAGDGGERGLVLAAGRGRHDDDLEFGVAFGRDVAVHRDRAHRRVVDRLAVLAVRADLSGRPQRGEPAVAGVQFADERRQAAVLRAAAAVSPRRASTRCTPGGRWSEIKPVVGATS